MVPFSQFNKDLQEAHRQWFIDHRISGTGRNAESEPQVQLLISVVPSKKEYEISIKDTIDIIIHPSEK